MTRPDPPRLEVTVLDRLISVAMWIIALCWMVPLMATMMVVHHQEHIKQHIDISTWSSFR